MTITFENPSCPKIKLKRPKLYEKAKLFCFSLYFFNILNIKYTCKKSPTLLFQLIQKRQKFRYAVPIEQFHVYLRLNFARWPL